MPPRPCAHCGVNFMKAIEDPKIPNLCNNCMVKENKITGRTTKMDEVVIQIKCPRKVQIEIEEYCINQGMSFDEYFLQLHEATKVHDIEKLFAPSIFQKEMVNLEQEINQEEEKVKKRGRPKL